MTNVIKKAFRTVALTMVGLAFSGGLLATAQNPQVEEKLMAIKQNMDANKARLAQYVWTEVETISIDGNVKDTKTFRVAMVNGQQQKTLVNDQKASSGGREGRVKERVVEKKTEEYEQYGQQISALAKQYTTPDPQRLIQAKQQGNLTLQPGQGTIALIIKNFVKPGDQVTLTIAEQSKALMSVNVQSFLDDPKDAVTIGAQFAQLPDGTNHVTSTTINGVSKKLVVNEQNSNYMHM